MAPSAVTAPNYLVDAGWLLIAPVLSSSPTNTVAGSVFTDSWPGTWIFLGATSEGTTVNYSIETEPLVAAEIYDPFAYRTVSRNGSVSFALLNYTASNLRRAVNGGVAAVSATSGSGTTALYTMQPPTIGNEVRFMLGWESADSTARLVVPQLLNSGDIEVAFKKAPDMATIPFTANMEIPSGSSVPFTAYFAGSARGGS